MSDDHIDEPAELVEARKRVVQRRAEARALADLDEIDAEQDARLGQILDGELDDAEAEERALKDAHDKTVARAKRLAEIRAATPEHTHPGADTFHIKRQVDPFDVDPRQMTRNERRDNAMRVMEAEKGLSARSLAHVEQITAGVVRSDTGDEIRDGDKIAERILITSRPAYRSAFQKAAFGHQAEWTDEERAAMQEARTSMSLADAAGGYGVPAPIDPSIILTSGAADAPLLSVARIETITNDKWLGVSSAGVSWSFDSGADGDAGGVEVSDDAPTLAQPSVTSHTARGFIPFSIEISMDYPNYAGEMRALLDQGYVDLIAAQSATGSGDAPQGIFTAIAAHNSPVTEVLSATNGEINAVDVRAVWSALPERYRANARWFMNVSVENQIRAAGNGNNGADFTVNQTAEGITLLNGKPVLLSDYAPDFSTTTTAQTNHLVLGDFRNFVVAQRAGMNLELVPHLFATGNNRPNGERGWFAWARVGHDSVNDNAFRALINASV